MNKTILMSIKVNEEEMKTGIEVYASYCDLSKAVILKLNLKITENNRWRIL